MKPSDDSGAALILVLIVLLVMTAMAAALALDSATDVAIAANHRNATAGLYAADAVLMRALPDIASAANLDDILAGTSRSAFVDGLPGGARTLADDTQIDPAQAANRANCGKPAGCSPSELTAITVARPWGANNPVWQPYAYGPLPALAAGMHSPLYVVVLVADDPAENDGDPMHDGAGAGNPGTGLLAVRAVAFGPGRVQQAVEVTIAAGDPVRIRSWRTAVP